MMAIRQVLISLCTMGFLWSMVPHLDRTVTPGIHRAPVSQQIMIPPKVIRFRVIGNSDNPVDQAVKLDVRDQVLAVLDPLLSHVRTRHQAAQILHSHIREIARVANQTLEVNHVFYQAHVALTTTQFPTKAYGSWVLPAGRYQALLVTLGKGLGHNWWCVLFPSLCFIDMSNAVAIPVNKTTTRSTGQAGIEQPVTPSNTAERIPAVPVHVPRSVPSLSHGHIRVSWSWPRLVNHLLGWMQ